MSEKFEHFIRDLLGVCSRKPHPKEGHAAVALIREIEDMASRMRDDLQRAKEPYRGPARVGHEAQYGPNDIYPGDPYPPVAALRQAAQPATLGQYLKGVRTSRGLTLRDVERVTEGKISNGYLSQLETGGVKNPSAIMLHRLAAAYAIDFAEIMSRVVSAEATQPAVFEEPEDEIMRQAARPVDGAERPLVEVDCNCRQPGLGGDCDGSCVQTGKVGRVLQYATPAAPAQVGAETAGRVETYDDISEEDFAKLLEILPQDRPARRRIISSIAPLLKQAVRDATPPTAGAGDGGGDA